MNHSADINNHLETRKESHFSRETWALALVLMGLIVAPYFADLRHNPPGFYIDESSISYNAYTISQTGRDESGTSFPLFFRAFGEYKNPIYIYLLAIVFRITGPGILAGRLLSVTLLLAAALVIGVLAKRLSGRKDIGAFMLVTALLTPWLFELSRVVLEVSLYPLAVAILLLNLQRANRKSRWAWFDALTIALSLTFLTYAYSIGRLFAPLLALGLLFFVSRARLMPIVRVWAIYALSLLPVLVFQWRHPDALMRRFHFVTFISANTSYPAIAWEFLKRLAGNFNVWRIVGSGDPNSHQIAAIYGLGQILVATLALSLPGLFLIARKHRKDPWWRFIIYGLIASAIPASLTREYFHMLRLAAMPVFVLMLCVPALSWLIGHHATRGWRLALIAAVLLTLGQGVLFQFQYHEYGRSPFRRHLFDADYPAAILAKAIGQTSRPIYLADAEPIPGYIQAYWYSTLQNVSLSEFKKLPPDAPAPAESIAITTEDIRPRCEPMARVDPYTLCRIKGEPHQPQPLADLHAELRLDRIPPEIQAGQPATVHVILKNITGATWFARERGASLFQVSVGNHWLDHNGNQLVHDDGRGALPRNLLPGEETPVKFTVNAPLQQGDYLLEVDALQEGVSWFGLRGSPVLRVPVRVK